MDSYSGSKRAATRYGSGSDVVEIVSTVNNVNSTPNHRGSRPVSISAAISKYHR